MNQVEVWKDIPGFEGLYQASNQGRIRSLDMRVKYKNTTGTALKKGRVLSPKTTNTGYLEVVLMKNLVRHNKRVHQLVALAFIPNPNGYSAINHINENKKDNSVENLEWCTIRQNCEAYTSSRNTVYQYNLNGKLVNVWHSLTRAAESVSGDKTGIQHCCSAKLKTYMCYIWSYCPIVKEDLDWRKTNSTIVSVEQLDSNCNVLHTYSSITEAAKAVGCNPSAITMAIKGLRKTIKGFKWRKKV